MALITDRERGICEDLDWRVLDSDDEVVELESWSPAGEDFIISIQPDESLYEGVKRNLDNFDADDHVELWIGHRGKDGVPESVRELLEDAEAIKEMLQELEKNLKWNLKRVQALQNLDSANIGDTIELGAYPYHEDGSKEPIEWQVLDKKKDKILVISDCGLVAKPFHEKDEDVMWETCSLRKWLNQEFLEAAFTEDEKQKIILSRVAADPNPKYPSEFGDNTDDKMFLLSVREAKMYLNDDRLNMFLKDECWWWLRTPGDTCRRAAEIKDDGTISYDGCDIFFAEDKVRPAMWLKIDD